MFGRVASRSLVALLAALLVIPVVPAAPVAAAAPASITLSSTTGETSPSVANIVYGDRFTIVATIDPDGPTGPEAVDDGTVTFTRNPGDPVTVPVTDGSASTTWDLIGSTLITATYQGGSAYEVAGSSSVYSLTVTPVPVTVDYAATPASPVFAGAISLDVTVDPSVATDSDWERSDVAFGGVKVYRVPSSGPDVLIGEAPATAGLATVALDQPAGVPLPAGTNTIRVEYLGGQVDPPDSTVFLGFAPGSVTGALTVAQVAATVGIDGPVTLASGELGTFTVTVGPAAAAYPPTGIVRLYDGVPGSGGTEIGAWLLASGDAGEASITLASPLAAGPHTLYATFDGATAGNEDPNRLGGTSTGHAVAVNKAAQEVLSITGPTSATYGAPDATIVTTGGSGTGLVSFTSSTPAVCSIVAGKLHVVSGTGTCTITATKAGDDDYEPTTSAPFNVTINKAAQATLSITAPASATYGAPDATISVTGGSGGGGITFSAGSSTACSIVGGLLRVTAGAGTCTITATKAADANYLVTTSAPFGITIGKAAQEVLSITGPTSATYGAPDATIVTTGGSGTGLVSFTSSTPAVCSIVAGKLHVVSGTGTCTITATKAGDDDYEPTTSAPFNVTINKAAQATLSITAPASATYGAPDATISVTGGSGGGGITFSAGSSTACSIVGGLLRVTAGAGTCTITATKAADANYLVTTSAPFNIDVNPRPITVTADARTKVYGDADPALTYQITVGSLLGGDGLSGSLTRVAGENVGARAIQQGTLSGGTNYAITFVGANLTITKAPLTVTADDKTKTYGAANPAFTVHYSGFKPGDTLATSVTGDPSVTTTATLTSHVATYPITVSVGTLASSNYSFTYAPGTLTVEKKLMTVTAPSATVTYGATPPPLSPQYDTAAWVGTDKANDLNTRPTCSSDYDQYDPAGGTYTSTCSGGVDNDYSFTYVPGTVTVNKKSLSIAATATTRAYGSPNPTLAFTYSGFVGTDDAGDVDTSPTCSTTATTDSPVATYPITCSGGADVNYSFAYTAALLSVTKAPLTVTADNKNRTYGAVNPALTATMTGFANGEVLATSGVAGAASCSTAATSTSPAGSYAITCTVGGLTAVNYSFGPFVPGTLSVGGASLTITANNATKTYGNANPAFAAAYGGFVAGDDAGDLDTPPTCSSAATTTTPVGTAPITCSGATDANYVVDYVPGTLTINKRALVVSATGINKEYDGTVAASVTLSDNRVNADTLAVAYTGASFATAAVGNGKTVNVTGINVTGLDAGNYTFNSTASTTADITKRSIAPIVSAPDKVYDGTTAAPGTTCALTGVLADDAGNVVCSGTAAFADKNVGTSKTVTLSGITLAGTAAGNYALGAATATDPATISPKPITVTATGVNKVYDGGLVATVTLASAGKVSGDDLTFDYASADFVDPDVGAGKHVDVLGITKTGADAANYTLQSTSVWTTAAITKATLTVTAIATNKVYDGTTAASVTLGSNKVGGDVVDIAHTTAAFNTKHVGTNKPVTVSGISIGGTDAGNYQLAATTAATTATITARPITVTAVTATKVYDGTLAAAGTPTITSGALAGTDTATWTQAFTTKTVGTNKAIVPAGTVSDGNPTTPGANYAVTLVNDTTGVITAKALTVSGISSPGKVYDGNTTAPLAGLGSATLVGRATGDTTTTLVTAGATGTFADKNVGTGKTVTVAGLSITGIDAANYTLTQPATTASIAKATLTVAAEPKSRPYGSPNPALTWSYTGFVGGETLATSGVTGNPTCSTIATTADGVGPYPIACLPNDLAAANYSFNVSGATLTITPAELRLTAVAKTRQYGLPNPVLTATVTGFVNGETAGSADLTGSPSCSTTALVTDNVGTRPITCAAGTLAAPNYAVTTLVPATLTITPAIAAPAVTSTANPAVASQDVTITATVTWPPTGAPGPAPTGTVTFFEGATAIAGPVALVGGIASFDTSWEAVTDEDTHDITAVYSGNGGNFAEASAAPFRQVVGKSGVDVVVTSDRLTWESSVPVRLTASVHPVATGVTREVAGTVAFRVDGVLKATVPVVAGAASYTTTLALGARSVVASFTPDVSVEAVFKPGSGGLAKTVVANTVNASGVGVSSSSVYPVKDTWKDTVAIRGTRNEAASVSIKVYRVVSGKDPVVKSASLARASGPYAYSWNGRTSSGKVLPAGKYKVVQVLADAFGAKKTYTSYVTLSAKKMTWYTKTITVSPGPRRFSAPSDPSIQSQYSTTSTGALTMAFTPPSGSPDAVAWRAVGYQFYLPSASTYSSLSFQVQGSWTGTTAPKIGLAPWNGGDWGSMYNTTRARVAMDTIATDFDGQTITNLTGIRSGRYVRAVIDSFTAPSGWSKGPFSYKITAVRLVVKYGILK